MKNQQLPLFESDKAPDSKLSVLLLRGKQKKEEPSVPDWELKEKTDKFIWTTKNLRLLYDYTWDGGQLHIKQAQPPKNSEEEFEKLVKELETWHK